MHSGNAEIHEKYLFLVTQTFATYFSQKFISLNSCILICLKELKIVLKKYWSPSWEQRQRGVLRRSCIDLAILKSLNQNNPHRCKRGSSSWHCSITTYLWNLFLFILKKIALQRRHFVHWWNDSHDRKFFCQQGQIQHPIQRLTVSKIEISGMAW